MSGTKQSRYPTDSHGFEVKPKPFGTWQDGILWNSKSVGKLQSQYDPNVKTVHDLFNSTVARYGDQKAVAQRELISRDMVEDPKDKKKYEKLTLGGFPFLTYTQWGERVRHFGSGMVSFGGLAPKDRVLIYAETQRDWMTAALSAFNHNLTIVTAYATLGADAAAFAINQTGSKLVVADNKLLPILLKVHDQCPTLKFVISMTPASQADKDKLEAAGVHVCSFDEAVASGAAKPVDVNPPAADDVAVIMFTSGTTAAPKGVVLPHRALISAITGMDDIFDVSVKNTDVYMAYLPLAHIMEMIGELTMMKMGVAMGYGNPHTLTDTGIKLAAGCRGDLNVLCPTIVVFAPLILEKIFNGIQDKMANASATVRFLFNKAMASGLANFDHGQLGAPWYWNWVFGKVRAMIGGKVRLIVTGSAPLDNNVHKFVQTCFGCPVRQGYGATETSAASVCQELCDNTAGVVGPPRVSCCIKMIDWEEGGYRFSDKDNAEIGKPRGEILIGGDLVSTGYLVDEANPDPELAEKNKTDFSVQNGIRYFHTGDIGQVDADGSLKIIDRKKDLVKLQQGEYVALSKVEGVLKLSPYVDNCLVHVSPQQKFCTALICPAFNQLAHLCKELNVPTDDMDAACRDKTVVAAVLKSCHEMAKGKLSGFEIPAKITLVTKEQTWTPENDLLTAAMKLKRKPIITAHQAQIDAMY